VDVAKEVFSVPLESVLEVVRIQPKDINTINGKEVVRLRTPCFHSRVCIAL